MSSANIHEVVQILGHISGKGVQLWTENGELRYRAPKGALTREEVEKLSASRSQVVELLERSTAERGGEPKVQRRDAGDSIPLMFPQRAHWNLYRLAEKPCIRQLASATRLRGALNVPYLERALCQMMERHEALRTRVVMSKAGPTQVIEPGTSVSLSVEDLSSLPPPAQEAAVQRCVEALILEPIWADQGPLFAVKLLKLREEEHVLIAVMEHMISDAFSMNIFLRDLLRLYCRMLGASVQELPDMPLQLGDYAVWQSKAHAGWMRRHEPYWRERMKGAGRVKFPRSDAGALLSGPGWGAVPIRIDQRLKAQLSEWCRRHQTTLAMAVFTTYAATVLRWCDVSDVVLRYQIDGRARAEAQNTIGYFAAILHLRIEIDAGDGFLELLERAKQEYCNAYSHLDHSYLDTIEPKPEFTRNAAFNWVPQSAQREFSELAGTGLSASAVPFVHPMLRIHERDAEPILLLYDTEAEIVGSLSYSTKALAKRDMERFARNLLLYLETLVSQPQHARVKDLQLR